MLTWSVINGGITFFVPRLMPDTIIRLCSSCAPSMRDQLPPMLRAQRLESFFVCTFAMHDSRLRKSGERKCECAGMCRYPVRYGQQSNKRLYIFRMGYSLLDFSHTHFPVASASRLEEAPPMTNQLPNMGRFECLGNSENEDPRYVFIIVWVRSCINM